MTTSFSFCTLPLHISTFHHRPLDLSSFSSRLVPRPRTTDPHTHHPLLRFLPRSPSGRTGGSVLPPLPHDLVHRVRKALLALLLVSDPNGRSAGASRQVRGGHVGSRKNSVSPVPIPVGEPRRNELLLVKRWGKHSLSKMASACIRRLSTFPGYAPILEKEALRGTARFPKSHPPPGRVCVALLPRIPGLRVHHAIGGPGIGLTPMLWVGTAIGGMRFPRKEA